MEVETADGETLYVADDEGDRGSKDAFLAAYRSPARERRYGYYCAHCGSIDVAMDTMGRVKCGNCGNIKKPEEWDAAHE